jgi:hypothetical protein
VQTTGSERETEGLSVAARTRSRIALSVVSLVAPMLVGCITMLMSSHRSADLYTVPAMWTWVMTVSNLVSMWAMSRDLRWGWRVAATTQPLSIEYCILTGQPGFVPGNMVMLLIYLAAIFRRRSQRCQEEVRKDDPRAKADL